MVFMKLLPSLPYPLGQENSPLSYIELASFLFIKVLVNPLVLKLLNILLYDLVNSDVKNLYISYTAS
jgi:hypothetical protein